MSTPTPSLNAEAYERLKGKIQQLAVSRTAGSPSGPIGTSTGAGIAGVGAKASRFSEAQTSNPTGPEEKKHQASPTPKVRVSSPGRPIKTPSPTAVSERRSSPIEPIERNTGGAQGLSTDISEDPDLQDDFLYDDSLAAWLNEKPTKADQQAEALTITTEPSPASRDFPETGVQGAENHAQSHTGQSLDHDRITEFEERNELLRLCAGLDARLQKLFEQYQLKHTAQSVLQPHVKTIESYLITVYNRLTKRITNLTRERDEYAKKYEAEATLREQETRALKLQAADKLAKLRLAQKRAIDKAVAEAQANMVDSNARQTETRIAEAERAAEERVRNELSQAKAESDARLQAQLEELERTIDELTTTRARELERAEAEAGRLRSRVALLEKDLETVKHESQMKILGLETSLRESESNRIRLSNRLQEAITGSKVEKDALLERLSQQAEASEQRYKATLTENAQQIAALKAAHQEELDTINIRVRHLIHKKEEQIRALQETVAALEKGLAEFQEAI